MHRKKFIQLTSLTATGMLATAPLLAGHSPAPAIKAVAFDAFPIFDPRPVFKAVYERYPDKGKQLVEVWQAKQFGYQWLRATGQRYKNFWDVTRDALDFAWQQCQIEPDPAAAGLIMERYHTINVWDDVVASLEQLKQRKLKTCFLSNMTAAMLQRGMQHAGIEKYMDHVISTDSKQTYKPAPLAYQMATDQLGLKKEEILFAPFAGWDMAGAKWFGYPVFWVNRLNAVQEQLDAEPDGSGSGLQELVAFIDKYNKK